VWGALGPYGGSGIVAAIAFGVPALFMPETKPQERAREQS
jgi:hypothetical protein